MTFNPLTTADTHPDVQNVLHSIVDADGKELHRDLPLFACSRLVADYQKADEARAGALRIVPSSVAQAPAAGPNPHIPADHFLPGLLTNPGHPKLYQVVAPDGRVVVNFLPHAAAWSALQGLRHHCGGTHFMFQEVPADQLGVMA